MTSDGHSWLSDRSYRDWVVDDDPPRDISTVALTERQLELLGLGEEPPPLEETDHAELMQAIRIAAEEREQRMNAARRRTLMSNFRVIGISPPRSDPPPPPAPRVEWEVTSLPNTIAGMSVEAMLDDVEARVQALVMNQIDVEAITREVERRVRANLEISLAGVRDDLASFTVTQRFLRATASRIIGVAARDIPAGESIFRPGNILNYELPPLVSARVPRADVVVNADDVTCTICIAALEKGTVVDALPCSHKFHRACLSQWESRGYNQTCPVCRGALL